MTIYDIAKEAGVSASTVSRVINDKPGIKAETRQKVQELLKKYSYVPDAAARGLVKQSSGLIGILIEDIRVSHHTEAAFIIEQEMTKLGYCSITMSTGSSDGKQEEYIRILGQRRAEGAVLVGSTFARPPVRESIARHLADIPVAIINGYLDLPNVSGIIADEDEGVGKCVDLLVKKGKRKIAFVVDSYTSSNLAKQQGYISGMARHGLGDNWMYRTTEAEYECGYQTTEQLLQEHPDVEGIIYSADLIATGGIRAIQDRGRRIPEDIAVIGVNNSTYGLISSPRLTSLDNQLAESSLEAAHILEKGIKNGPLHQKITMFSRIVERETT